MICGSDARETIEGYEIIKRGFYAVQVERRIISGTGCVVTCNAPDSTPSGAEVEYTIEEGITELGDNCFANKSIYKISLPKSLKKIGNGCFDNTKIKELVLPEGIEYIGCGNLSSSLTQFFIPASLQYISIDNFEKCDKLNNISVDGNNSQYRSIDGVLYDKLGKIAIVCPQGRVGDIVLPSTVTAIGDKCFAKCAGLSSIVIPPSVKEIGDYSFFRVKIAKLNIPNSVMSVGEGCFEECSISKEFIFSACVENLPHRCFYNANIPNYSFLRNVRHLSDECFAGSTKGNQSISVKPPFVDLRKSEEIGHSAISLSSAVPSELNLYSTLNNLGANFLFQYGNPLTISFFSYCPIPIDSNAFSNLKNAKLVVPTGTGLIFKNSHPWSIFQNIEEQSIDSQSESCCQSDDSSLQVRIESIINSIQKADRVYLRDIIETLSKSYTDVVSDQQFCEAMQLIRYNKKFNPPIVADLENFICHSWSYKYRLKFIQENLMSQNAPLSFMKISQDDAADLTNEEETPVSYPLDFNVSLSDEDVYFDDILKYLQSELSIAKESVKIAVSWFTNFELFKQIKELSADGIRVQLITNNDSINNGGYCLNLNQLIDSGVEISLVEYPHLLHHKFCIIDEKTVVNGSYNWTRFSEKNYENLMVIRNNAKIVKSFSDEFDRLWNIAELKDIEEMPETVPPRPEYDRHAFKQYITEELDEESKSVADDRSKISISQKAYNLNPEYHKKLNPGYSESPEQKEIIEDAIGIAKTIAQKVAGKPIHPTTQKEIESAEYNLSKANNPISAASKSDSEKPRQHQPFTHTPQSSEISRIVTKEEQKQIDKVKASTLFLALDVSGSMSSTFSNGHVHNIAKQVLSTALAISDAQGVSVWTFGDRSNHAIDINLGNISEIGNIHCQNSGTNLKTFTDKATSLMTANTLAIIFTDDDGVSIAGAIPTMKERKDVFWQIISYEQNCSNIRRNINLMKNASLVSLYDYANQSKDQIQSMIVEGYIKWRKG